MKHLIELVLLSVVSWSCTAHKAIITEKTTAVVMKDVAYGADPQQKMDVYLPAHRNMRETKVLIMIHGGGWGYLDKNYFNPMIARLQRLLPDYAIFNIDYRLAVNGAHPFPAQEQDVSRAVSYIYSKRKEYKVSRKLVLLGESAGAHLALLQGYKYGLPVRAKAIVSLSGPVELMSLYNSNTKNVGQMLESVLDGTPQQKPLLYKESSPLNYVNRQSPPTILFIGAKDIIVPMAQSDTLCASLQKNHVPFKRVVFENEGHNSWNGKDMDDMYEKITTFLNEMVK